MKKTIIRLFALVAVLFISPFDGHAVAPEDVQGDVNRNWSVDIEDVSSLIDYLLEGKYYINCDVNGDLEVDIEDIVVLIDYLLGTIDDWPWLYKGPEMPDSALVFTVNGVSFAMMPVEGCDAFCCLGNPDPQIVPYHTFPVRDFYMGLTQVTYELWEAVMGSRPNVEEDAFFGYYPHPRHPVSLVTWYDCQEFITRLNELTGREFHLPNLIQWTYAASGGKWTHDYDYAGSNDLSEVAWTTKPFLTYGGVLYMPVGTKKPNELGLYDMSGNGFEWCHNHLTREGDVISLDEEEFSYGSAWIKGSGWIYYMQLHAKTTIDALTFRLALQMDE